MPVRNVNFTGSRLRLVMSDSKLTSTGIQVMYGAAIVIWLLMTYFLNLWVDTSKTTKLFLALPVAVFVSNIITPVQGSDIVLDPQVTQGNLLSYILIGGSILSPWLSTILKKRRWHHTRVIKVFVIMTLFLTLTQFDFFTLRYIADIEVHSATIINTFALSFIGYTISEFFHVEYRMIDNWAVRSSRKEETSLVHNSKKDQDVTEVTLKQTMIAGSQIDHGSR